MTYQSKTPLTRDIKNSFISSMLALSAHKTKADMLDNSLIELLTPELTKQGFEFTLNCAFLKRNYSVDFETRSFKIGIVAIASPNTDLTSELTARFTEPDPMYYGLMDWRNGYECNQSKIEDFDRTMLDVFRKFDTVESFLNWFAEISNTYLHKTDEALEDYASSLYAIMTRKTFHQESFESLGAFKDTTENALEVFKSIGSSFATSKAFKEGLISIFEKARSKGVYWKEKLIANMMSGSAWLSDQKAIVKDLDNLARWFGACRGYSLKEETRSLGILQSETFHPSETGESVTVVFSSRHFIKPPSQEVLFELEIFQQSDPRYKALFDLLKDYQTVTHKIVEHERFLEKALSKFSSKEELLAYLEGGIRG